MSTDTDLGQLLETEMSRRFVNWGNVRRLCEEIDRQRKQADAVAARLLGKGKISPGEALFYLPDSPEWKALDWQKLLK